MLFICFCCAVVLTLLSFSKAIGSLFFFDKYVLWVLELGLLQLDASSEWEVSAHTTGARSIVSAVPMPSHTLPGLPGMKSRSLKML